MRLIGPKDLTLAQKLRPETEAALLLMQEKYPATYEEIWEALNKNKWAGDLRYYVAIRIASDAGFDSIYDCFYKVG